MYFGKTVFGESTLTVVDLKTVESLMSLQLVHTVAAFLLCQLCMVSFGLQRGEHGYFRTSPA